MYIRKSINTKSRNSLPSQLQEIEKNKSGL